MAKGKDEKISVDDAPPAYEEPSPPPYEAEAPDAKPGPSGYMTEKEKEAHQAMLDALPKNVDPIYQTQMEGYGTPPPVLSAVSEPDLKYREQQAQFQAELEQKQKLEDYFAYALQRVGMTYEEV